MANKVLTDYINDITNILNQKISANISNLDKGTLITTDTITERFSNINMYRVQPVDKNQFQQASGSLLVEDALEFLEQLKYDVQKYPYVSCTGCFTSACKSCTGSCDSTCNNTCSGGCSEQPCEWASSYRCGIFGCTDYCLYDPCTGWSCKNGGCKNGCSGGCTGCTGCTGYCADECESSCTVECRDSNRMGVIK